MKWNPPAPAGRLRHDAVVTLSITPATDADWPLLWPIIEQVVAAGDSYAYPEDLDSDTARALWMEVEPGRTVVARDGGTVVGTAKMGPNRPGRGAHIATASFMVDPGARRGGVGRAMGEYVIDWAGRNGYRGIQFNAVVESNLPAVSLWTDLGFELVGTVPEAFAHATDGYVGLHVMFRRLDPSRWPRVSGS